MKNLITKLSNVDLKTILIICLLAFGLYQWQCGKGNDTKKNDTVKIDGKKYEVLKHDIDTVEVVKTKVVTKKGEDIYHEVIEHDTLIKLVNVDTASILRDYLATVIYKDTLHLPDSLGTVALLDSITKNRLVSHTFDAKVRERIIKETTVLKELKAKWYYGAEIMLAPSDKWALNGVSAGLVYKGVKNNYLGKVTGGFVAPMPGTQMKPFIGGGIYKKIGKKE